MARGKWWRGRDIGGRYAPRLLPVWPVAISAVFVAIILAAGVYFGLRSIAVPHPGPNGGPAVIDPLDVIKTTITVAGFVGAVLVGVYGYRKQRLIEGDARRADAEQLAQRYTTAAEQLGHDKAAVRLAGVYAMARLADDWDDQRQVCIDVLCAYLRMPYEPNADSGKYREGEREVRHTVQEVLFSGLRQTNNIKKRSPGPNIDLNLRGAQLDDIDLSNCLVRSLDMVGCHLSGRSNFDGLRVTRQASFCRTTFKERADFHGAAFADEARFNGARFQGEVRFIRVNFFGDAEFDATDFVDSCWFSDSIFHMGTVFDNAQFRGMADFVDATFLDSGLLHFGEVRWLDRTYFNRSRFAGKLHAMNSEFAGTCVFSQAQFGDSARFDGSRFLGDALFSEAEFNGAWFADGWFAKTADFEGARIRFEASFSRCEFAANLVLSKSRIDVELDLSGSHLLAELQTENATFAEGADLSNALISSPALRTVDDQWPLQWAAIPVWHEKDDLNYKLNRMSRAPDGKKT